MKRIVLKVVCMLAVAVSIAQDASADDAGSGLVVLVTDGATRQVIVDAEILVEPGGHATATNAEGIAELRLPGAGTYVLYVSASGYVRCQALKVTVVEGHPTGVSTSLRGNTYAEADDVEAPNDGRYLFFMDSLPTVKGGMKELERVVVYPEMAQRGGIGGTVFVRTYVSETGVAVKAVVERSAATALDRAALRGVMRINFDPARHAGKNVKSAVTLPIRFHIGENR
jgi:TonB family protein